MRKIIITDLTRFQNPDIVCTAGTDIETGACVRPMPYLKTKLCVDLGILPGAILRGDFVKLKGLSGPHQEDAAYSEGKLAFDGPSSSEEFRKALEAGLQSSVEDGFEIKLSNNQKHVPIGHKLKRSIVTIKVKPKTIEIVEGYNPGTTRVNFTDGSGREFVSLSITDLGFHRYARTHQDKKDLTTLNAYISKQKQAYLRIGLGRAWDNGKINGYWMQVNGIYTFPEFFKDLRSYK